MGYDKNERRVLNKLSEQANRLFNTLERTEKGEMLFISELCACLENVPMFIVFSCLSGNHEKRELGYDLGSLFTSRRRAGIVREVVGEHNFMVFVDDTEPVRIWQWDAPQEEVTSWYQLVLDSSDVPENWDVRMWSKFEVDSRFSYKDILTEMQKPEYALVVHHRLQHMKEFPNKKLRFVSDVREAATRRVAQYALQGIVLEKKLPSAILFQNETPWNVKDPLYQTLRRSRLPIIHPFEERR
ncbi:MAG: hypothetical protein Q8O46_00520 [bacterium]|nr:hypothetical protein [bacterium]